MTFIYKDIEKWAASLCWHDPYSGRLTYESMRQMADHIENEPTQPAPPPAPPSTTVPLRDYDKTLPRIKMVSPTNCYYCGQPKGGKQPCFVCRPLPVGINAVWESYQFNSASYQFSAASQTSIWPRSFQWTTSPATR